MRNVGELTSMGGGLEGGLKFTVVSESPFNEFSFSFIEVFQRLELFGELAAIEEIRKEEVFRNSLSVEEKLPRLLVS